MKKKLYFSAIFLLLFICLILIIYLFNYNKLSKHVQQLVLSNKKLSFNTKLVAKKFPIPQISVDNLSVDNKNFLIKKVKIYFSPLSLLTFQPKVSHLVIEDANITIGRSRFDYMINLIDSIYEFLPGRYDIQMMNVNCINLHKNITHTVNALTASLVNDQYLIQGVLDDIHRVKGTLPCDSQQEINLEFSSENYSLIFKGSLNEHQLPVGSCRLLIKDLSHFINSYYYDIDSILNKFNTNEQVELIFDTNIIDQMVSIKNLKINSASIEAVGSITHFNNPQTADIINITFSKLALNQLFFGRNSDNIVNFQGKKNIIKLSTDNSDITITAKNVLICEEKLTNISFISKVRDQIMNIHDFSGTISSGGSFKIAGKVKQNQYRSLFEGKIRLEHNNINNLLSLLNFKNIAVNEVQSLLFESNIRSTIIDHQLYDINMQIGSAKIQGSMYNKLVGSNLSRVFARLTLFDFDLNKSNYPLISSLLEYYQSLSTGIEKQDYVMKFVPLNTINYNACLNLNFKSITFQNQEKPSKLFILAYLFPGQINIDNFYYRNGKNNLIGKVSFHTKDIKPKINVTIDQGELYLNNENNSNQIFNNIKKLIDKLKYQKVVVNLNANLQKLLYNNKLIQDLAAKLAVQSQIIEVKDFNAHIDNSEFKAKGGILMSPLSTTLVYAYNSFHIPTFSFSLQNNATFLPQGLASMQGTITTNGENLTELINNLNVTAKFIAKDIEINNMSLDYLIDKVTHNNYIYDNLQQDINIATDHGKTIFQTVEGDFQFNKGVLQFSKYKLNTEQLNGEGTGVVMLDQKKLEFNSYFKINSTKDRNNLSNQKLHLKFYGDYHKPVKTIQFYR
ncbi:asmA family protein [Orientia chuto str. Dubai]|uniref:AsmA family protein n=1 Tax=Orientia chuto str. Dubai TaxID=1359168 RepID=A0A0F3MKS1_9RICK|nr:AsmA-like C-terminal region-containing protein [Candidatus Orientia mediorientalis]KJV56345.1 asmA family protein [Orientia chuto str. Dubai]